MEKKGESLENIIALIQETLKDSPNTRVFKNYKIENTSGRDREIDVLIEANINGFDLKIAIECKDYKNRVSVEKIEAFEGKCNRIKSINKKVFVSSNGFQADAMNAAKEFGIELQVAEKLNSDAILNWFPITNIAFKILNGGNSVLITNLDDISELNSEFEIHEGKSELPIMFPGNKIDTLNNVIIKIININRNYINNLAFYTWMKLDEEKKKQPFIIPLIATFDKMCILHLNNKEIGIKGIEINIEGIFEETQIEVKELLRLESIDGELKADTLTFQLEDGVTGSIVKTPNNKTTFHVSNAKGETHELKVLAIYDPKINKLRKS